jgi:hypothetical protein
MEPKFSTYFLFLTDNYYKNLFEITNNFKFFFFQSSAVTEKTKVFLESLGFTVLDYEIKKKDSDDLNLLAVYKKSFTSTPNEVAILFVSKVIPEQKELSECTTDLESVGIKVLV